MSAETNAHGSPNPALPLSTVDSLPSGPPEYARPLPGESAKHFALFCAWLALAPSVRVATQSMGVRAALKTVNGGRVPAKTHMRDISGRFRWIERARAYDTDTAERTLKATGDDVVMQQVRQYRHRQQRLAAGMLEICVGIVGKVGARLLTIDPEDLAIRDIPPYLNSVARLAEFASSSEAEAIGLTDLLTTVEALKERAERLGRQTFGKTAEA